MTRPAGLLEDMLVIAHARDLYTDDESAVHVLDTANLTATIAYLDSCRIKAISTTPVEVEFQNVVGHSAMGGFRGRIESIAPQLRQTRSPLYALLDDLPVASLVSGHALAADDAAREAALNTDYRPVRNQCAGFVDGGYLMSSFDDGNPATATGPDAPHISLDDPQGWHPMSDLAVGSVRRVRRIDVSHRRSEVVAVVDAMFRDTYVRADGVETIIHEYTVEAKIDAVARTILMARATPRVLPWQECPGAVDSARQIEGMRLSELHSRIRTELTGITTCTHLNDALRSLGDVDALLSHLDQYQI